MAPCNRRRTLFISRLLQTLFWCLVGVVLSMLVGVGTLILNPWRKSVKFRRNGHRNFISRAHLSLTSENANGNPDLHRAEMPDACDHFNALYAGALMRWILFQLPDRRRSPVIEDTVRGLGAVAAEYECDDVTEWAHSTARPGHLDTREVLNALGRLNRDLWHLVGDPVRRTAPRYRHRTGRRHGLGQLRDKPQLTPPALAPIPVHILTARSIAAV